MPDKSFQDSNDELRSYWKSVKDTNFDASFSETAQWIRANAKDNRPLRKSRKLARAKWILAALIPVLFIVSCTYQVKRVEKFADLINFSLEKHNAASLQRLASLQQQLGFKCYQLFQPELPNLASFISLVKNDAQVIGREISGLSGVDQLTISPINYSVRESLFSTFVHTKLKLGESPKPKKEEVKNAVQQELSSKGLAQLEIDILIDEQQPLVITNHSIAPTTPDSPTTIITSVDTTSVNKARPSKTITKQTRTKHLENFEWLLGSWRVLHTNVETWHYWVRMSDSVLKCYIVDKPDGKVNMTTGFYIKRSYTDEIELHFKREVWMFSTASGDQFLFKNGLQERRTDVTWTLKDNNTWQSIISGEGNKEFTNLWRQHNQEVEDLVKLMMKNNPDKGTKY